MSIERLRFTEFNESYEKFVPLSNFIEHISDRNKNNKVNNVLSVSNKMGFINQSQQFEDRIVASKNLSNYKIVHKYDFAYNPARINVGSIARLERFDSGIVSPMYIVFRTNDKLNSEFLKYFLDTKIFNDQLTKFLVGSVRQTLDFKSLLKIKIRNKGHEEQEKIGNFLSLFDRLIEKIETKIGLLKELKKGYLQQIFPAKGEKVPKIRFTGFNEDWEYIRLNSVLDIKTDFNKNQKYNVNNMFSVSLEYGILNQIDHLGRSYAGKDIKRYKITEKYDLIYTKSPLKNAPYGIFKTNFNEVGLVSPLYAVYKPTTKELSILFDHYFSTTSLLNNYLRPKVNKGAKNTMNITDEVAIKGDILLPTNIKEQEKIGNFFRNLDLKLEKIVKDLNVIEQLKKGYMQRLFA